MSDIIKQIEEHQVYNVVSNIHDIEDIECGDYLKEQKNMNKTNKKMNRITMMDKSTRMTKSLQ